MNSASPCAFTVCVIDDDEAVRDSLHMLLMTRGFAVRTFDSAKAFLACERCSGCHCLLIDMHMPGMSGLALLRRLQEQGDMLPAFMISGGRDHDLAEQASRAGAWGLLEKPISAEQLFDCLDRAFANGSEVFSAPH